MPGCELGGPPAGPSPESPGRTNPCRAPISERPRPGALPPAFRPHVSRLQPPWDCSRTCAHLLFGTWRPLRKSPLRSTPSSGLPLAYPAQFPPSVHSEQRSSGASGPPTARPKPRGKQAVSVRNSQTELPRSRSYKTSRPKWHTTNPARSTASASGPSERRVRHVRGPELGALDEAPGEVDEVGVQEVRDVACPKGGFKTPKKAPGILKGLLTGLELLQGSVEEVGEGGPGSYVN